MYQLLNQIKPLDTLAMEACQLRVDNLTKPLGCMHHLEHIVVKLAGVTGQKKPQTIKKTLLIATASESCSVTVETLAAHAGATVSPVNVTGTITDALNHGFHTAKAQAETGICVIGLGSEVTDYKACEVLIDGLAAGKEPFEALDAAGSAEIAVLTGTILGAAAGGAVVVLDGLATAVAALAAVRITPLVKDYLIGSHYSVEPNFRNVMEMLGLPAYLHLNMRYGNGAGAALGLTLVNASLHMLNDMKTFGEAAVAVAEDGPGALKQRPDVK